MNKVQKFLTGFIFTSIVLCNTAQAMKRQHSAIADSNENVLLLIQAMNEIEHEGEGKDFIYFIHAIAKRPKIEPSKKINSKISVKHEVKPKPRYNLNKYTCNEKECDFATPSVLDVYAHCHKHAVENGPNWQFDGKYRCNDCEYYTSDTRAIKKHQICHIMKNFSNVKVHACDQCDYLSHASKPYNLHVNTHLPAKIYGCEGVKKNGKKCEFKTRHSRSLNRHILRWNQTQMRGYHYRTDLIKHEK